MSKSMNPLNEKHTILIVEDSPTQAEKLKYLLEENNFQVTVAKDGNEALNFLQVQLPDMIISDILMPGMDGYALCSKIKSDEKLRDIPVMLLTSLSDSEDVVKGLTSGADNFVTKPYNDKTLLSQVDYILINKRLRGSHQSDLGIEIYFDGKKHKINSNRLQIVDLLLSTYETAVQKRREAEETLEELKTTQEELRTANEHLEEMVLERTLRIEQLYELLKVIRNVNQFIVKTRDRDELIRRTCEIFTESQHFSCAWIVLLDDDGKVTDIAESGHGKLFDPIRANLNKNILPPCAQQALETKELVIIRNTHQVCRKCPLSVNEANHLAFSIALRSGDTTFGTLNVGSSIAEPDEEMISLFEEAVGDIGFALYDMALEEKHKRAEETLQASEARYRRLFETAKDGILILDYETGEIIDVNPFLIELLDYSYPEFLGKHLWEIGLLKDIAASQSAYKILQQEAYIRFGNLPLETRSGKRIEVEFVSNVYNVNRLKVIQCNIRDITERWQAQEALRTSATKLSIAMEISKLGYWEYDVADDLFTFNDQFYSIFRTTAEKVGGYKMSPAQYAERFLHPDDRVLVSIDMSKAFETTDPNFSQTLEHRIIYADGEVGYISVHYLIVKDEQGRTVKTYGANQDITEKKRLEAEKQEMETQFRESQKMESIGTLAGGIAHDFNNLLTVIQGHAQMAMMAMNETSPQYKDLAQIHNASTRAAGLTRQLLLFSRNQIAEIKIMDLNLTIQNLLKMIKRLIGENIVVDTKLAPDLSNIEADEGNIEQVIMNLTVNARDAMPEGGKLMITTENVSITESDQKLMSGSRPGEFVRISVEDTGCGIPKELLSKIFEPFFSTKEKGKGTGLGLSVVYGIIKSHGGWINVYSEPQKGSVFKIYLPVSAKTLTEKSNVQTESTEFLYGNGEHILVIEDEKGILDFTATALRQFGYIIQVASNGQQARSVFEEAKGNFQLIVSDVVLPDVNGYDLVSKLIDKYPHIPVVMCSGYTEERVKQSIIQEKGFKFLQKPYSLNALLSEVKKAILKSGK